MSRSSLIIAVLLAVLSVVWCETVEAAEWLDADTMKAALRTDTPEAAEWLDADTMKAALRTDTPEENGFIDYVVALVHAKRLPPSLVHSTFHWARRKSHHRFQYFRRGLIIRARRQGIRL